MAETPIIHVFDKGDYSKHRLVTLPPTTPQPLPPSSLRLRTKILGQTTNNLTYANLGFALGWWDVYPQPSATPAPYNDRSKYATIAGWGYATVVESTFPGVQAGASVYGYVHIGTGTWDVSVASAGFKDQLVVASPHRQHLWTIYNRLSVHAPISQLVRERGRDGLGWDALMLVLFGTGYNLSTFGFAWEDARRIHPAGEGAWSAEDARLEGAVVVVLNAGGKTGMGFAYALRHARPEGQQPRVVIGVGSETSAPLLRACGLYDEVLMNGDAGQVGDIVHGGKDKPAKVVLLDFGARPGVMTAYTEALEATGVPLARFFVGGDNAPRTPEELMKARGERGEGVQVNANTLREKGIEVGGETYFTEFDKAWEGFVQAGAIKGTELVWGEGMEGWERGWEAFCKDEVRGGEGRVYKL